MLCAAERNSDLFESDQSWSALKHRLPTLLISFRAGLRMQMCRKLNCKIARHPVYCTPGTCSDVANLCHAITSSTVKKYGETRSRLSLLASRYIPNGRSSDAFLPLSPKRSRASLKNLRKLSLCVLSSTDLCMTCSTVAADS